ncbi:uridine kinase [Litorimonas sp. RW-G-Af-16]|uniref:uridine kinase n=1 Tax=Litorimonas sp. RW-G-Af-16 TaxID=3241168 RepID=UPI00390CAC31
MAGVPQIIAIAGGSCSGKTTLAKALREHVGRENCLLIRQDDYYFDLLDRHFDEGSLPNFDIPEALDFDQMRADLLALQSGKAVALPSYDFATHRRREAEIPQIATRYIILEGLLLLSQSHLRELFDMSVYVRCDEATRLERRQIRDIQERGRTAECVLQQFHTEVRPAHDAYIRPSAAHADLVVPQEEYVTDLSGLVARIHNSIAMPAIASPHLSSASA